MTIRTPCYRTLGTEGTVHIPNYRLKILNVIRRKRKYGTEEEH